MTGLARLRIARAVLVLLITGWGLGAATAAAVQTDPDLAGLPWLQVLVGVLIAAWGGVTATLGRWLAARYDGRAFHWPAELARDAAVSVTVGAGSYFAGAVSGLSAMQLGLLLLLAGYLGVRVLSGAAERLMAMVARQER